MSQELPKGLQEDPFDYQITRDEKVLVFRDNRQIMMVAGKQAQQLIRKLDSGNDMEIQLALAKVTGNYKRGNERSS